MRKLLEEQKKKILDQDAAKKEFERKKLSAKIPHISTSNVHPSSMTATAEADDKVEDSQSQFYKAMTDFEQKAPE